MKRKKRVIFSVAALVGIAVVIITAVFLKGPILERWYLSKLESQDRQIREHAAERLGELQSVAAVPRLIEYMRGDEAAFTSPRYHFASRALIAIGEEAVPALVVALDDPAEEVRRAVRHVLGELGPRTLSELLESLKNAGEQRRAMRIRALGSLGPGAVPHLVDLLADEDESARNAAVEALREVEPPPVQEIASALQGASSRVRAGMALALGRRGLADAVPVLARLLGDRDASVRVAAAESLADVEYMAQGGIPALIRALQDVSPEVRRSAAEALGSISMLTPAAVAALLTALTGEDEETRESAAEALDAVNSVTDARAVLKLLLAALGHESADVRGIAIDVIGNLEGSYEEIRSGEIVPPLIARLRDSHSSVQIAAAEALESIAIDSASVSEAVPELTALLKVEDDDLREAALDVLAELGPAAEPALPAIRSLLGAERPAELREAALETLQYLGKADRAAKKTVLLTRLETTNLDDRVDAAEALIQAGVNSPDIEQALIDVLQSPDDWRRPQGRAARALSRCRPLSERAVQALLAALGDEEAQVREEVAEALVDARASISDFAARLREALVAAEGVEREGIVRTLGALAEYEEGLIPDLVVLLGDRSVDVRAMAARGLGGLGEKGRASRDRLIELLDDPSIEVAKAAADSLIDVARGDAELARLFWARIERGDTATRSCLGRAVGAFPVEIELLRAALRASLGDADSEVRYRALVAISELEEQAVPLISALCERLWDEDESVREQAAETLGELGERSLPAVRCLVDALAAEEIGYRLHTVDEPSVSTALGQIGEPAVSMLLEALGGENLNARRGAAYAFSIMDAKPADAVPELLKALDDPDPVLRGLTADALGHLGRDAPRVVPRLVRLLDDPTGDVRAMVAFGLRGFGETGAPAVEALIRLLDDSNEMVRALAARSLGEIGKPSVPGLAEALKTRDTEKRSLVAMALSMTEADEAIPALRGCLGDEDARVQGHGVLGLVKLAPSESEVVAEISRAVQRDLRVSDDVFHELQNLGSRAAPFVPLLIDLLADREIRQRVVDTLGIIGPAAKAAIPALTKAKSDPDEDVHKSAVEALKAIQQGNGE